MSFSPPASARRGLIVVIAGSRAEAPQIGPAQPHHTDMAMHVQWPHPAAAPTFGEEATGTREIA
ncbi:hypothetical protein EKH55_1810 [Sinorhizobium alkalisoli]|nr:hypothetical protein EKH55_1810 [Sinorhizobium alkalisoli]